MDRPRARPAAGHRGGGRELSAEGPGDILVFCSGEREIRDAADALERGQRAAGELGRRGRPAVRPAVGRRAASRLRAASGAAGRARHERRGDVADRARASATSSTPATPASRATASAPRSSGCRSSAVSQASALQRAGRCGRLEDGICIRLYSQEDHDSRPPFTDPEITRTNLASVLLQMAALGLGDPGEVEDFPFVDAPDRRGIRDGLALLYELGALTRAGRRAVTPKLTADRPSADPAADRPAARPDGARSGTARLRRRGHRHRRRAVDPGSARAAVRPASRPPTRATPASPIRPRTSWEC